MIATALIMFILYAYLVQYYITFPRENKQQQQYAQPNNFDFGQFNYEKQMNFHQFKGI